MHGMSPSADSTPAAPRSKRRANTAKLLTFTSRSAFGVTWGMIDKLTLRAQSNEHQIQYRHHPHLFISRLRPVILWRLCERRRRRKRVLQIIQHVVFISMGQTLESHVRFESLTQELRIHTSTTEIHQTARNGHISHKSYRACPSQR